MCFNVTLQRVANLACSLEDSNLCGLAENHLDIPEIARKMCKMEDVLYDSSIRNCDDQKDWMLKSMILCLPDRKILSLSAMMLTI